MIESTMKAEEIKKQAQIELAKITDLGVLHEFGKRYFNRETGEIPGLFKMLRDLAPEEKAKLGKEINGLKAFLEEQIEAKKKTILGEKDRDAKGGDWFDVTIPGKAPAVGYLHPLTKVLREIEKIFGEMGFSVIEGPELENEWYNFDALNIPRDHPARDMWDTFWIDEGAGKKQEKKAVKKSGRLLLRTHTSPVQIRYMEKFNPPLKIIVPGRVFRHEATDASHETNFYQVEGLVVDKKMSAANFKFVIQEFLQRFFAKPAQIRLIPTFFPFTEPSFQVDLGCVNCGGSGCSVCVQTGWLEIMGSGMVHPNVLKNAGLNPDDWQGFAFGMGVDRLAMLKYKINDIRLFYGGDLRFLEQF